MPQWSPSSWLAKTPNYPHQAAYADQAAVDSAVRSLRALPPLVTSWEIERLKRLLADASRGRAFILQGGDCAERLADCRPDAVTGKLKILLQMSLVLVHAMGRPVIRVGRIAGQYAKPRTSPTETHQIEGIPRTLPSYYGDLVNREAFDDNSRRPDPAHLVTGYLHAAVTLNFIRSLVDRGFADVHHPENWELGFLQKAGLPPELRQKYARLTAELTEGLRLAEAMGHSSPQGPSDRTEFFTSHEGLNLLYESAQTRRVPRREGFYCLTTHLPWLGDRTRDPDGAHVEFFRGVRNPVGIKLGPSTTPDQLLRLCEVLNPEREPGKLVLIARLGAAIVSDRLPALVRATLKEGWTVEPDAPHPAPALWSCDPMHGNTLLRNGARRPVRKTRAFTDILSELVDSCDIHAACGSHLAGLHVELTHEDVTECLGGASGITEADLDTNYATACDPRLNYEQALELAFRLGERLAPPATPPSAPAPPRCRSS
ncbi:MAG: 3-deoxy-7-phosphoheptulonate synthase [Phycisphaerales bacterium]|nr:3-deoxy-7-phosphoheptulonate synthase [Phycisphaerales bacterium]